MKGYVDTTWGDRIADVYDTWFATPNDTSEAVDFIASLHRSGPVLEIGACTGRLAVPLHAAGIEVHALEASANMVQRLHAKDPNIAVCCGPPRDALEAELAAIWRTVLPATDLGITDDFFDIGGHSLAALAITARIRERFGVELPVVAIFDHPTIAALSEHVRSRLVAMVAVLSDEQVDALLGKSTPRAGTR